MSESKKKICMFAKMLHLTKIVHLIDHNITFIGIVALITLAEKLNGFFLLGMLCVIL